MIIEIPSNITAAWGSIATIFAIASGVYAVALSRKSHYHDEYAKKSEIVTSTNCHIAMDEVKQETIRIHDRINESNGLTREVLGILKGSGKI